MIYKKRSQKIYPFCLDLLATKADMYSDLGFDIEQSWRGFKHWDRLQTGIRFVVNIILTLITATMISKLQTTKNQMAKYHKDSI